MKFSNPGRHVFTTFAIVNLCLWIALACLVGLVAGDQVDLGLETFLRTGQATVVAAWDRQTLPASPVSPAAAAATAAAPVQAAATSGLESSASANPSAMPGGSGSPLSSPPALAEGSASGEAASPAAQPPDAPSFEASGPAGTAASAGTATGTGPEASAGVTPSSPAIAPALPGGASDIRPPLRSALLLLKDAPFDDLSRLDAEMELSASGRPVQISYQEAVLNREVDALLVNNAQLPYRDVTIDVRRDRVLVTGRVSVLGFEVDVAVDGALVARDCQPQFQIGSVAVAGIATPGFVKARVAEMVGQATTWVPAGYPLCIEQVVLEETGVSIYGRRR